MQHADTLSGHSRMIARYLGVYGVGRLPASHKPLETDPLACIIHAPRRQASLLLGQRIAALKILIHPCFAPEA